MFDKLFDDRSTQFLQTKIAHNDQIYLQTVIFLAFSILNRSSFSDLCEDGELDALINQHREILKEEDHDHGGGGSSDIPPVNGPSVGVAIASAYPDRISGSNRFRISNCQTF